MYLSPVVPPNSLSAQGEMSLPALLAAQSKETELHPWVLLGLGAAGHTARTAWRSSVISFPAAAWQTDSAMPGTEQSQQASNL